MSSRDLPAVPAREWWTVVLFLVAVGRPAAAQPRVACFATGLDTGIVVLN